MKCPDCKGVGRYVISHVHYADGSGRSNVPMKCSRCKGKGKVPDEMADWIATGERMRLARLQGKPYRSLWEEAARRGMKAITLSKMEFGKIKPIPEAG
jgi:hypothetical protein